MPIRTIEVQLNAFTSVPRTGSTQAWDSTVDLIEAKTDDGVFVFKNPTPVNGLAFTWEYLQGIGITAPASWGRVLNLRTLAIRARVSGSDVAHDIDDSIRLIKGGVFVGADKATNADFTNGNLYRSWTFSQAELLSLGITKDTIKANPADFGAAFGMHSDGTSPSTNAYGMVDQLTLIAEVLVPGGIFDMDRQLLLQGGLEVLSQEAMPACSVSTAIFANAPLGCQGALLTIYSGGADVTIRFDGGTATTTSGNKYYAGDTAQWLPFAKDQLKLATAIQSTTTATGWITYFGVK